MSLRFSFLLTLGLASAACTRPGGDWTVAQGSVFPETKVSAIERQKTTAGEVVALLGTPYVTKPDLFVYAVQYTRPVERDFLLFRRPYTERVTLRAEIYLSNGVVMYVKDDRVEQLLPVEN